MHENEKECMEKEALVLIEYQRDWIDADGKIHYIMEDKEQFYQALKRSEELVEAARKIGMSIIHVGLSFQEGHPELGETTYGLRGGIRNISKAFAKNDTGSEFVDPFTPHKGEFVVSGRTGASGFAGSNLDSFLRNNRINKIYLAGFALHVCVESTLRHGHDLGYEVIVVEDATSAFNQQQRKHVLEEVIHHFGESVTVKQFIEKYQSNRTIA